MQNNDEIYFKKWDEELFNSAKAKAHKHFDDESLLAVKCIYASDENNVQHRFQMKNDDDLLVTTYDRKNGDWIKVYVGNYKDFDLSKKVE